MDKLLENWQWLIQIPLVSAIIVYTVYILRMFLNHMDELDKRRTASAADREKERAQRDVERDSAWRAYLENSRDAYLNSISNLQTQFAKSTESSVQSMYDLTAQSHALVEVVTRHEASTSEILKRIVEEMARLREEQRINKLK